jgi:hypothetical protein
MKLQNRRKGAPGSDSSYSKMHKALAKKMRAKKPKKDKVQKGLSKLMKSQAWKDDFENWDEYKSS